MGKVVHSEPTSFDVRQFLSFKFSAFQAQVVSDVSHNQKNPYKVDHNFHLLLTAVVLYMEDPVWLTLCSGIWLTKWPLTL